MQPPPQVQPWDSARTGGPPGQVAHLACPETISCTASPRIARPGRQGRKALRGRGGGRHGAAAQPPLIDLAGQADTPGRAEGPRVLVARSAGLETAGQRQDGAPRVGGQRSGPTGRERASCHWGNASGGRTPPSGGTLGGVTLALGDRGARRHPHKPLSGTRTAGGELAHAEHLPCQALARCPSSRHGSAGADRQPTARCSQKGGGSSKVTSTQPAPTPVLWPPSLLLKIDPVCGEQSLHREGPHLHNIKNHNYALKVCYLPGTAPCALPMSPESVDPNRLFPSTWDGTGLQR